VGILKGTNFGKVNDKIIGLGAHYDTVAQTKGNNRILYKLPLSIDIKNNSLFKPFP
jgi:hypothetical protein